MKRFRKALSLVATTLIPVALSATDYKSITPGIQPSPLQRVIVLSDIDNEPDDAQSFVRLLMYSNDLDIRGLIASTSTHMRNRVAPNLMLDEIEAYSKVYSNLQKHSKDYPTPDYLKSVVKAGLPVYGMNGVGKGKDSEGSELIVTELQKKEDHPLWVVAWGGTSVLAQALYKLQSTLSAKDLEKVLANLRVYTISDQDDCGAWIRKTFPSVFYIVSPGDYTKATWTGMNNTPDSLANKDVISPHWLYKNIQTGHGPLSACYPDIAWSMEGDTPSFLGLIRNGLNNMEHPDWGGWGGRYGLYKPEFKGKDPNSRFDNGVPMEAETRPIWTDVEDTWMYVPEGGYTAIMLGGAKPQTTKSNWATIFRWREEVQNNFAARMDWCNKSYEEANHEPVPTVKMYTGVGRFAADEPQEPISNFTVKSEQNYILDAAGTTDPDGDNISYYWMLYPEAGTIAPTSLRDYFIPDVTNVRYIKMKAPKVTKPEYIHVILRVTDKGTPRMASYARVIIKVVP